MSHLEGMEDAGGPVSDGAADEASHRGSGPSAYMAAVTLCRSAAQFRRCICALKGIFVESGEKWKPASLPSISITRAA